jgi:membrane-bound lytic murein transglycosylase B
MSSRCSVPSSEQRAATEFFTTAARNLQQAGARAGVARYVVVSIVGIEKSAGGYGSAKLEHEQAVLAGPVPARILRVTRFHELAGPREENLASLARLAAARRRDQVRIEEVKGADPDSQAAADGSLLPGPHAKLAGPTFEEWLTGHVTEDQPRRRLLR